MGGGAFTQGGTSQGLFGQSKINEYKGGQTQFGNNAAGAGGFGGATNSTKFNVTKAEQQLMSINQPF